MTSERQTHANRANAQASTGPTTAHGKARSAQNALRHGLSVPIYRDPAFVQTIELWARRMVGARADPDLLEAARRVVEAQLELQRVQTCRVGLINRLTNPYHLSSAEERQLAVSMHWLRLAQRGRLTGVPAWTRAIWPNPLPLGPEKLVCILGDFARELNALDRYERRARSRRKRAVREFDQVRKEAG